MKLTEIEFENPLEIVKQSKKMLNGVLKTSLILQGNVPGANIRQSCKVKLNEDSYLLIHYLPNGVGNGELALEVHIETSDVVTNYFKTETSLIATNGNRFFRLFMDEFKPLPYGVGIVAEIVPFRQLFERRQAVVHGNKLLILFRIWIDTSKSVPMVPVVEVESLSKHEYERIRQKIYDPGFGDSAFIVAGVKMYGHSEIMSRNNDAFRLYFRALTKKGLYYEFPDTYPQLFERMLISCYLADDDVCRICVDYHNWMRRADKSAITAASTKNDEDDGTESKHL